MYTLKGSPLRSDWSTAGHVSTCRLFIANWCLSRLWCVGLLPGPQLPACFETWKSLFNQFSSVPSILATSAAEEALWQKSRRGRGRPDPALMQNWKGVGWGGGEKTTTTTKTATIFTQICSLLGADAVMISSLHCSLQNYSPHGGRGQDWRRRRRNYYSAIILL